MIQLIKFGKVVTVCTKLMYFLLRSSENKIASIIGSGEQIRPSAESASVLRSTRSTSLRSFQMRTKLSKPTNFCLAKFRPKAGLYRNTDNPQPAMGT